MLRIGDIVTLKQARKGDLTVRKDRFDVYSSQEVIVSPRDHLLVIEVHDTGPGIPEEIQGQLFDPFYTTKEEGQGTGLGLSVVYGIIQKHQGNITVESKPGKGSSFLIYLPLKSTVTSSS